MKNKEIRLGMVFSSPVKVREAYQAKLITWKEAVYYINKFGK